MQANRIVRVQLCELLKYADYLLFGSSIRRAVDVMPIRREIWPDQQLKSLKQTVIAWTVLESILQITSQPAGGDASQHGNATRWYKYRSPSDSIDAMTHITVPALQTEGSLAFAARP